LFTKILQILSKAEYRSDSGSCPMQTAVEERNGEGAETSVRLDIVMASSLEGDGARKRVSPFEPQVERTETSQSASNSGSSHYPAGHGDSDQLNQTRRPQGHGLDMIMSPKAAAPEKKITLFALRLAILEKAATGLGTLAFVWATVVLLGGFAIVLERADFWFVTVILLIEGARIFSRSSELEWQHETTLSMVTIKDDARRVSNRFYNGSTSIIKRFCGCFPDNKTGSQHIEEKCRSSAKPTSGVDHHGLLKRTWSSSKVQLVPYTGWLFISKNVSRLLFWLQLFAASTCVVLSLDRLTRQNFGQVSGNEHKKNRNLALNIFYGLALAEALLFLLEKAYWQWKIIARKLLPEVNEEYGFDDSEVHTVRRFFYDAYSQCVKGSVFDGLKMDFVTYSVELVQSNGAHGQRTGTRILSVLVNSDRFSEETLRAIGTMSDVVERLIEMLNWNNHHEQEIRREAAVIITKLVRTNRNCIRVAAIAGSLESIASLLYDSKQIEIHLRDYNKTNNLHRQYGDPYLGEYEYSVFSLLGLRILKNLAKDHDNCAKIGSSKDLLPKIIGLAEINPSTPESEMKTVKLALHLVRVLASSTGLTGKILRKEICEIVFAISNLRDILQYRETSTYGLQILAIDTLTSLALDDEGRDSIGSTGGVFRHLFSMFFMERNVGGRYDATMTQLVSKAGEALALLALESKNNCRRMITVKLQDRSKHDSNLIAKLISVLEDEIQGIHAARILRNLCAYTETDYAELREVTAAAAQVVKFSMEKRGAHQEAAIGLAAQIFKFMTELDFDRVFKKWRAVTKRSLFSELVEVFRRHPRPSKEVPSIRRFSIELLIGVMEMDGATIEMRSELEGALKGVMETTSELESYSTFSGSVGLSRHRLPIQSLVQSAMELLRDH
jgi:hypothetical protein